MQLFRRDYEACVDTCRRVLDLDAQYTLACGYLGLSQCLAGSVDDALETLQKACDSSASDPLLHAWFGYVLGRAGKPDEARKILAGLRAHGEKGLPSSWLIATVHVGLGENDEALARLRRFRREARGGGYLHWASDVRPHSRPSALPRAATKNELGGVGVCLHCAGGLVVDTSPTRAAPPRGAARVAVNSVCVAAGLTSGRRRTSLHGLARFTRKLKCLRPMGRQSMNGHRDTLLMHDVMDCPVNTLGFP